MLQEDLDKAQFEVFVSYLGWGGKTTGKREVKAMYLSDAAGNPVEGKYTCIALEMGVGPEVVLSALRDNAVMGALAEVVYREMRKKEIKGLDETGTYIYDMPQELSMVAEGAILDCE